MATFLKKRFRFSTSFPFIKIKRGTDPHLIVVKNLLSTCQTESERYLYHLLRTYSYYPTPHYSVGSIRVNIALVPYKLALVQLDDESNKEYIFQYLKKRHWNVIFYDQHNIGNDEHFHYLDEISQQAPIHAASQRVHS